MGSELDRQLKAIMERLTAPRATFARETITRDGADLVVFRNAPDTLPDLFAQACAEHADTEFLVDGNVRLNFGEVYEFAARVAAGLADRHGVRPGDRVGIVGRNSANWIIAYMGVLIAGGCATLLNGWWIGKELGQGIELAECSLVLADPERTVRLSEIETSARVVTFDHGDPGRGLAEIIAPACGPAQTATITPDDPATILFTSGSTGKAKAAWSDHRAIVQATMSFAAQSQMLSLRLSEAGTAPAPTQVALLCVPLFHVTGEIAVLLQSFLIGRRIVIMPRWNALEAMRLIESEAVTFFVGVPLMSYEIATHPDRVRFDLSTCKSFAAGGSPRPAGHVGRIRNSLPDAYPMLGYGLTETNCVGCSNFNENYLAKPHSTGPVSTPLVELAILDGAGSRLPAGETGEVAIRSICNIRGYWNDPAATAQAIRPDGFLLTGDLGYLDDDGYLVVVDRKKDIIIRGGENISCNEVEEAIYSHAEIAEACVFGLRHDLHGEVPVAVVKLREGSPLTEEGLRAHLAQRLATFKIPVHFWREIQPLPRLGTQKVDKISLKARYSQVWEAARTAA